MREIQVAVSPLGSFPKSEQKTEPSPWTVRRKCPGTVSDHRGTSGHTLRFGHLWTILFAQASHSKTYPLLPDVSIAVADPKRMMLLLPMPTPAKMSMNKFLISVS